jgi:hypothetical protein
MLRLRYLLGCLGKELVTPPNTQKIDHRFDDDML